MINPCVLLYSILCKNPGVPARLRRWPRVVRVLRRFKLLAERHALPKTPVWVRAQSGLSKGMWMKVRLPEELPHWRGDHEPEVQVAISAMIQTGAVVYDVGAHIGTIALGAARLVGARGRVIAFDGDPDNVTTLRESRLRNHLETHLEVVHAAVWSYTPTGGISFRRGGIRRSQGGVEADGHHPVVGTGEIISVPAITLDDFIARGGPPPQLIKIDVEGGEYEVLRGGNRLFATPRPLIIVEVHHEQAAAQICVWLGQYRYCAQWNIPRENFPRCLLAWPIEHTGAPWALESPVVQSVSDT